MLALLLSHIPAELAFIHPHQIQELNYNKFLIKNFIGNIIFLRSFYPLCFSACAHAWAAESRVITGNSPCLINF
jgi:hypothetical protein